MYGDGACKTGAFEVTAGTTLIHSKLTMGHGKCQTDEELDAVLEKVEALLPKAGERPRRGGGRVWRAGRGARRRGARMMGSAEPGSTPVALARSTGGRRARGPPTAATPLSRRPRRSARFTYGHNDQ